MCSGRIVPAVEGLPSLVVSEFPIVGGPGVPPNRQMVSTLSEEHKQMTPKRLGIVLVALVALWSLVGPAVVPHPRLVPGITGVNLAIAGDPDQYTNKPSGGALAPQDTIPPPPSAPVSGGGGGPHTAPSSTLITVVQVMSTLLWGKGTIY